MNSTARKRIRNRVFEDYSVIESIDKLFIGKRGYVFTMPPPGSEVVLLVSGGLDSMLTWGVLFEEYGLKVCPLFLNKGESRATKEENAVDYFADYYSRRYPDQFIHPYKQSILLPQKEIMAQLHTPYDNLENFDRKITKKFHKSCTTNIFLGSPGIVPLYALLFAREMELLERRKIRTIFSSVMLTDGLFCPSQTITALRAINLSMCTFTGEYDWQFTSLATEPYLNNWWKKRDLIRWGARHDIPMEHSWSCFRGLSHQCGDCLACSARIFEFEKAKIQDKTIYKGARDSIVWKVLHRLRNIFI